MATREEAIKYLSGLGNVNPDDQEIQGAMEELANPTQTQPETVAEQTADFYKNLTAESTPITPDSLKQEEPFKTPKETPQQDASSILNGIPTAEDILGIQQQTEAEKNVGTFQTKILDLAKGLGTREAEQLRAEEAAGLMNWKKELQSANQALKEHKVASIKRYEAARQTGETLGFAIGQAGEVARTDAIRGMELSLQVQAMQGNVELAQSQADRAVNLKFAPMEAEYKYLTTAYALNKDLLEREDKKKADLLAIKLDERKTMIQERKDMVKNAYDMAIKAIENNPGNMNALNSAKEIFNLDPSDPKYKNKAFNLVGKYQGKLEAGGGIDMAGLPLNFANAVQQGRTGQDLLNSLSPIDKATVQSLLDYTKNPANLSLRKVKGESKSEREKMLSMAHLIDPTYDEAQFPTRSAVKKDFNSGKSAQNIRSLNTAVGHLETLADAGKKLQNSSLQLWNKIANFGLTSIGDSRVTNFETAATAVESELASVFKGMGATDQEIKAWRENINSAQSPEQITGAINTAIELMGSRLQALTNQYELGIGKPKDFRILSANSRQILTNLGIDVDAIDPISSGIANQSQEGDTHLYNGVTYKLINGVWTPQ